MVAQIHEDLLNEQIQKHRETAGKTKVPATVHLFMHFV